jgi:hypothetical protein
MLAYMLKAPSKFDCLKQPSVLALEDFSYSIFHLIALLLFVAAIVHTLSVRKIHQWARNLEIRQAPKRTGKRTERSIAVQLLYFLSEVEIIFAAWVIPLFFVMAGFYGFSTALAYINTRDFTEPLFVVIILSLAMSRPVVEASAKLIHFLARGLGGALSAWWFTLLTIGPLLGSLITEAGAMGISAILLSKKFYEHRPSSKLAYVTIALLFVNISVGGLLTNFASPAVLILSHTWNWSNHDILMMFGWKAALGIVLSNSFYWFYFRKEFAQLNERQQKLHEINASPAAPEKPIPHWITVAHFFFMAVIVMTSHYPAIFIAAYLFFIGFHQSTRQHQCSIKLTRPLLVGLFLAGLAVHGGLQGWWVVEALQGRTPLQVLGLSISLTAFNDNAAIAYLATLIPNWGTLLQYALFTGVVAGGGLTVIANAPNPAGYVILSKHFEGGLSPLRLFLSALFPTFILYMIFLFFSPLMG